MDILLKSRKQIANYPHEKAQSTCHLPKLLTGNMLRKETPASLKSSVVYNVGQG